MNVEDRVAALEAILRDLIANLRDDIGVAEVQRLLRKLPALPRRGGAVL